MRLTFILLFLAGTLSLHAQTEEDSMSKISTCLNYYLDGGTQNDFDILQKAFHSTATMRYIGGENYQDVNAVEFFKSRMKPGPAQDRKTRIVSIDVTGNAASAKIEIEYPTFYFYDYMHVLLINGEWKIVSKIFYKKEK